MSVGNNAEEIFYERDKCMIREDKDVDFEDVAENVQAITPVPGGGGTVTKAVLLKPTIIGVERL